LQISILSTTAPTFPKLLTDVAHVKLTVPSMLDYSKATNQAYPARKSNERNSQKFGFGKKCFQMIEKRIATNVFLLQPI